MEKVADAAIYSVQDVDLDLVFDENRYTLSLALLQLRSRCCSHALRTLQRFCGPRSD